MNAYKLTTNIPRNRTLNLILPPNIPSGPVEIIMIYNEEQGTSRNPAEIIEKTCGSLIGSKLTTERFSSLKRIEKELER